MTDRFADEQENALRVSHRIPPVLSPQQPHQETGRNPAKVGQEGYLSDTGAAVHYLP